MNATTLVIELAPGRLEAAVVRAGRGLSRAAVATEHARWDDAWKTQLREFDAPLKELISKCTNCPRTAVVFYHSPSNASEVLACPSTGRDSGARQAALLAIADQSSIELDHNPHAAQVLLTDPAGDARFTHTLATIDTDETGAAIASWLIRAGLMPDRIIPMQGAHLASLVRRAREGEAGHARLILRVGEQRGCIAAFAGGRLKLVRNVELDLSALTDALTRPIVVADAHGAPAMPLAADPADREVKLTRAEARALLMSAGVPERGTLIDESRRIKGDHVLPLLQPVLQRCLVEMRQSMRFSLEEIERATTRLVVIGPGAAVPRLGEVVAAQLGVPLEADNRPVSSDLSDAIEQLSTLRCSLLPRVEASRQSIRRIRRAMWTGAALAGLAALGDGVITSSQLAKAESDLQGVQSSTTVARQLIENTQRVAQQTADLTALASAVDVAAGPDAQWAGVLRELAAITPSQVRIDDINLVSEGSVLRCDIRARAIAADVAAARADVSAYLKTLAASPLVDSIKLGSTETSGKASTGSGAAAGTLESASFNVSLMIVPVPRSVAQASSKEERP